MRRSTATLVTGLAALAVAVPATATAKGGNDGVTSKGTCSKSSSSKLKIKPDSGRIETEFEVDQNRSGVRWKVTLRRNGRTVVSTKATTSGRSGSFSVNRRLANGPGADRISARATSPSGEVCTATATLG
jgi:hypothetical protein